MGSVPRWESKIVRSLKVLGNQAFAINGLWIKWWEGSFPTLTGSGFALWRELRFGWVRDDDNSRRFRKFYLSLGRKNGKSCLGAGLALYCASLDVNPETRVPESVAQVILAATKREQIEKVIFSEVSRMVEQSPYLKSRSQIMNKQVLFRHNQGSIACVGSDKSYDGLNASLVLLDELHAWKHHHQDFYNTMQTGSASTRSFVGRSEP